MARRTGAGGSRVLAVLPFILGLLVLILVIVTLAAGTRPGVLDTFDFVSVDTSNLHIGAKLADSAQLKDLSAVSGVDLVGQDLTASSLGLGTLYTITVLSSCSHGGASGTTCTSPRVGYAFDPRTDLKLDQTAVAGTFPQSFIDGMAAYSKSSTFVASGYLAIIVFLLIASISAALASRARVAGFGSVFFSAVATAFLIALSVVSRGGASRLVSTLNDNLSSVGISASVGSLFVLTWVATLLSLLATVGYALRMRNVVPSSRARRGQVSMARSVAVTGQEPDKMSGAAVSVGEGGAPPKPGLGLWGKMPTWKSHRYVQIERQPAIVRTDAHGHEEATLVYGQPSPSGRPSLDEQDITQGQRGIKMVSLGQGGRKDMSTAYEPYKQTRE